MFRKEKVSKYLSLEGCSVVLIKVEPYPQQAALVILPFDFTFG